jgi:hypothetical protein
MKGDPMILSIAKLLSVFVCLPGMFLCFAAAPNAPTHSMIGVRDVSLVGALQPAPSDVRAHGDVAGYKILAFIGKWVSTQAFAEQYDNPTSIGRLRVEVTLLSYLLS